MNADLGTRASAAGGPRAQTDLTQSSPGSVSHPPQSEGLGLFQLEGEGRPVVPQAWRNDEWDQVQRGPCRQAGLLMKEHGTTHFLQDGAPCLRSKVVKDWFAGKPSIELSNSLATVLTLNP